LRTKKEQKYNKLRSGRKIEKVHGGNHTIDASSHSTIGINTFYYNWRMDYRLGNDAKFN
jgi:hypothetical protein